MRFSKKGSTGFDEKIPIIRIIVNQKYKKIRANPHFIGCLKLFLIHSIKASKQKIVINKEKIKKFSIIIIVTTGISKNSAVIDLFNKFELYSFTKPSAHFFKII